MKNVFMFERSEFEYIYRRPTKGTVRKLSRGAFLVPFCACKKVLRPKGNNKSPAEHCVSSLQEIVSHAAAQHRRFMLFLPVDVTAITTLTLLPQRLQIFDDFLEPDLAETSVFDFPAILRPSFQIDFIY